MEEKGDDETFERSDDGNIKVPSFLPADYLEIAVLILVLGIGVPLNGWVLQKLYEQYTSGRASSRYKQDDTRMCFLMLKIHLTIVDLILIILYCPTKLIWLLRYVWSYGPFLCKAVQYSWMFAHHSMSFAVVSIALDRVKTVFDLMKMQRTGRMPPANSKSRCITRMIFFTYVGAAVFALPQWFVWTTVDLTNWSQCTTIWHRQRALDFLNGNEYTYFFPWEKVYSLVHLVTVFWGPFLILVFSYTCITFSLFFYSLRPPHATPSVRATHSFENGSSCGLKEESYRSRERLSIVEANPVAGNERVPSWRVDMRSRMCHTSAQVILAYLLCWLPYNLISLVMFFSKTLTVELSIHFDIVRVFVIFNTLLNPFIYGFRSS